MNCDEAMSNLESWKFLREMIEDAVDKNVKAHIATRTSKRPPKQMRLFGEPEKAGEKVYFMSAGNSRVKIGRTRSSVKSRQKSHQTGNPEELTVIAVIPGASEKLIHELFHKYRIHPKHEWFEMSPEINEFLRCWQVVERVLS